MDPSEGGGDNRGEAVGEKRDIRRPMNAFLIFCKRHRSMVREKHPDRDNRSVTRILGDLWANLAEDEKLVYTNLAKQYKDAFMKAHPDYKWHSSEKVSQPAKMATRPTNARPPRSLSTSDFPTEGGIMPGQLADPDKMGGLNLLLMAGQHSLPGRDKSTTSSSMFERRMMSPDLTGANAALLQLAEMCSSELRSSQAGDTALRSAPPKKRARHWSYSEFGHASTADWANRSSANDWHLQALTNPSPNPAQSSKPPPVNQASATYTSQSETGFKRQDGEQKPETNPNPAYFFSSKPEFQQLNQKPSSLVPVPEEKKPAEDVPHGASADVSIPPKKKFTKLQETCKAEKSTASESSAEPQAGCLSDQNDNAIFTCGKLVVNHIIDRLFSANFASDQSAAAGSLSAVDIEKARKILTADITERDKSQGPASRDMGRLLSEVVHKPQNLVEKVIEEAYTMDLKQFKQLETAATAGSRQDSAETDTKPPALDQTHASEELSAQSPIKDWTVESTGSAVKVTSEVKLKDLTLPESTGVLKEEPHESMQDEDESFMQPVRKSQRRNRGQRYQELINEGIIQPSKERLAARRHELTTPYTVSYHLGDEAGTEEDGERRHSLKRSISESDSISGDEKRYRTGDFDLEAEIATLPPCSLEQVTRRRASRKRSDSESSRKQGCPGSPTADDSCAPGKSQQNPGSPPKPAPLTGSQKRKARKHSISRLVASTDAESGSNIKSPVIVTTLPLVRDATVVTKGDSSTPSTNTVKPEPSVFFPSKPATTPTAAMTTLPSATMTTTALTTAMTTTPFTAAMTTTASSQNSGGGVLPWLDTTSVIAEAAQKIQQFKEDEKGRADQRLAAKNGEPFRSGGYTRKGCETQNAPKMASVSSEFTNLKELDDDTWIPCYIPKGESHAGTTLYAKHSERCVAGDSKGGSKTVGSSKTSQAAEKVLDASSGLRGKAPCVDLDKGANSSTDKRVRGLDSEGKIGGKAKKGQSCVEKKTLGEKSAEKTAAVSKGAAKLQQRKKPSGDSIGKRAKQQKVSCVALEAFPGNNGTDNGVTDGLSQGAKNETAGGKADSRISPHLSTSDTAASSKSCVEDATRVADNSDFSSSSQHICKTGTEGYASDLLGKAAFSENVSLTSPEDSVPSSREANMGVGLLSPVAISTASQPQRSETLISVVTSVPSTTLSAGYSSASLDFSTLTVVSSSALASCVDTSVSMTTTINTPSLDLDMMDSSDSTMETAVGGQMLCQSPIPGSPSVGVVHS